MGILYPSELPDPAEWVGVSAQDIIYSIQRVGGWAKVFPQGVPRWLHKLRNYFNVEPKTLRLVDPNVTAHWMREIRSHGKMNSFVGKRALTGHVYFDEEVEVWYQMSAGGTIYHWGADVVWAPIDAAHTQKVRTQAGVPVFKLICPDGTGGSKETIITNPVVRTVRVVGPRGLELKTERGTKLGETNQPISLAGRIEARMKYQGSYNFSETAVMGIDAHEKSDVDPHKEDRTYIDPPDRFEPLSKRIFNEFTLTAAGAPLPKKR